MKREEAIAFRNKIEHAAATQTDEDALESMELYPMWETGLLVKVGERYRYGDKLYKVIQGHTTQIDWTPDKTPALWVEVSVDEWPAWKQPLGSEDSYMTGDKVSHNEKHWISFVDGNVWEPGAVGTESLWQLVEEVL